MGGGRRGTQNTHPSGELGGADAQIASPLRAGGPMENGRMLGRSRRGAPGVRRLAWLILALSFAVPRAAWSQTPSPLQEWQYSGGLILARLFEPDHPDWRVVLGAAAEVQPVYGGARAYRMQGGPVINV